MAYWKADDETQIYYEDLGRRTAGNTLLLLPGLLGSIHNQWSNFIAPLRKSYRLVLVDLRGHGRSENQAIALEPERMVKDLVGLLNNLGLASVHVAGYSLGGYLGLNLALFEPRRVRTLLTHGTKIYWTEESASKMREQLDPDRLSAKVPAYADQLALIHGAVRWRSLVRQAADLIGYLSQNGLPENMAATIQCPVLVSVGDRDELVPVREAQRFSRVVGNGALLVLPGVQHPFQSLGQTPLLQVMHAFHKE